MDETATDAKINFTGGKAPQNPTGITRKPFLLPIKVSSCTCVCVGGGLPTQVVVVHHGVGAP